MKIKNGFTLSEILVTLGLIGVVAAITIPTITNVQPNQELVLVKKSYYNISRVVSELINDEDFYPDRDNPEASGFSNTSIADQTGDGEATFHGYTFSDDSKFCGLFASKLNIVEGGDPNDLCQERTSLSDGGNYTTVDGIAWSMPVGDFAGGSEDIYIDVNGPNKGANCTTDNVDADGMNACADGVAPDRFTFTVGRHGNISIPGRIGQLYATSTKINKQYADFIRDEQQQ